MAFFKHKWHVKKLDILKENTDKGVISQARTTIYFPTIKLFLISQSSSNFN